MSLASRFLAPAVLAALLASPGPADARGLVPDTATATSMQVAGRAFDVTQRGVRIRVEPLDEVQIADWFRFRTRSGRAALKFDNAIMEPDDGSGEPPKARAKKRMAQPLEVFAVSLENGAGEDVTFLPAMASIFDQFEAERSPLPSDFVRELFRAVFSGTEDPDKAADESMAAVHSDPVILKPGQRVSRLMVFSPADPKAKIATLYLRHIAIGHAEINPVFPFLVTE